MIIKKLILNNFKSFPDQTIDFTKLPNGFIHIQGKIGSGKTSLGEAILFGLYGTIRGKKNKSLLSWGTLKGSVELEIENSRGNIIHIVRDMHRYHSSKLLITIYKDSNHFENPSIDGEAPIVLDGSTKVDIQKTLETEYYDIPSYIMDMLCIISFNNFKSLSTLNTKDSRQLLDFLLGLDQLNPTIEKIKNKISTNKEKLIELNTKLSIKQDLDKQNKQQIKLLEEQITELESGKVKLLNSSEYYELTKNILPDLKNKIKEKEDKIKEYGVLINNLNKNIKALTKTSKNHLKHNPNEICNCPTCNQPINESVIDNIKSEIKKLENLWIINNEDLDILNQTFDKHSEELKMGFVEPLSLLNSKVEECKIKLKHLETSLNSLNNNTNENSKNSENGVLSLEQDILSTERESILLQELLEQLTKEVRSKIIAQFVPLLNQHIENYSSQLALPYQPYFTGNEFECKIRNLNQDDIDITSLSTGQTKSVDMIVILSIITTILHQNSLNILFLDELFTNLDNGIKYKLINILKSSLPGKKILAISHENFPDSILDGTLKIDYNYPHSKIEL